LVFVIWILGFIPEDEYTKKKEALSTRDVTKDATNVTFWGEKVAKVGKVS